MENKSESQDLWAPLAELLDQGITIFDLQNAYVRKALARCHGNKAHTAKLLGVSRAMINVRIRRFEWEEFIGNYAYPSKYKSKKVA